MKRFVVISDFGDRAITSEAGSVSGNMLILISVFNIIINIKNYGNIEMNLPGVPGRLLFLLLGLGGLGFEFEFEVLLMRLEGTETASSDIIFEI